MSVPAQSSASSRPQTASSTATATNASASATGNTAAPSDAAAKLAEALDDFLGDVEKKFKNISNEIMTKLDDMAERCDRLEQEMMMRDASSIDNRNKSTEDMSQRETPV